MNFKEMKKVLEFFERQEIGGIFYAQHDEIQFGVNRTLTEEEGNYLTELGVFYDEDSEQWMTFT